MALALLKQDFDHEEHYRFRFDLGENRFWRFAVGTSARRNHQGAVLLSDPQWISPLMGPLPEHEFGRGHFTVPPEKIIREARFVQLMSYRDQNYQGPAVSEIVEARKTSLNGGLAPISFSRLIAPLSNGPHTAHEVYPMRWREARHHSSPFFVSGVLAGLTGLGAALGPIISQMAPVLLQALPSIAGMVGGVGPVIGQLLGAFLPKAAGEKVKNAGQALAGLSNDKLRSDITELRNLLQAATTGSQTQPATGAAVASAPLSPPTATQNSLARARMMARSRRYPKSFGRTASSRDRSEAMVIPIVAAAAGQALLPLLKQVLTPETVQQVLQMPNQHMQTIFNAMRDAGRLALESADQNLKHLRELNPGVDDPALDQLLASMSLGLSQPDPGRDWIRAASVKLELLDVATAELSGRQISIYQRNTALSFPVKVNLPVNSQGLEPEINGAILQLQVKNAETLEVIVNTETAVDKITRSGRLDSMANLRPDQTSALPDGKDLLFCITLIWKNSRGEYRGAPLQHMGRISPQLIFNRVEPGSQTVALADQARFGDYWHKFWGSRFREGAKKFEVEARYLFALSPENAPVHHRLETIENLKPVEGGIHRVKGSLRTGMEVSVVALARLGAILDPTAPAIGPSAINALNDTSFNNHFNRAARAAFTFRGSRDEAFELFAFPVMSIDTIIFKKPGKVNANGAIVSFEDIRISLPIPRSVIFTGFNVADGTGPNSPRLIEAEGQLVPTHLIASAQTRISRGYKRG